MRLLRTRLMFAISMFLWPALHGIADDAKGPEAAAPPENAAADPAPERGAAIYRVQCAMCHGESGNGVEDAHPEPLVGDLSIGALADIIAETMPEDDPEACVGDDAEAVAAYVHHAFYSEAARVRNRTARIELSRLTATQLRQSVADLYARSGGVIWLARSHGLRGMYYDGPGPNRDNLRIERVDPVIEFDFGRGGPGDGVDPQEFFIQWRGAIHAETTGEYEVIIRSSCSFMCFFGEDKRVFMDNHVQSGDKTEFRESIVLTAGRVYPIRINFVQRKRTTEQPPAMISLAWKPPGGVERIIPSRRLLDVDAPPAFSLQTKLPPDDRSYGFERGVSVDRQWDESTTAAAVEFARIATDELWPRYLRTHPNDSDENRGRLRGFLAELAATAFRGPLDDETRKRYVDDQVDAVDDDAEAIKRAVLITLKSPRFLYPSLDQERDPSQRAANRLALTLFDSLPSDAWMEKLVREKQLEKEDAIRGAARRMVHDFRTKSKTLAFLHAWLNVDQVGEIAKDDALFAGFDAALVADLRASLDLFLDDVVWNGSGDFRELYSADWAYTTDRLAAFYGEDWEPASSTEGAMRRSVRAPGRRFGVLSHPFLLSKMAYRDTTSPIHRGVFLTRHVLGRTLRPPNEAFTPFSADLHPNLTTRERVALQTSPENCQVCHETINGLGFTLENYDAVGRYRLTENEKPIDASGHYATRAGERVELADAQELAAYLATSDDSQRAFVNKAFQFFVKQPPAAFGPNTLDRLFESFKQSDFHIPKLLIEIAVTATTEIDNRDEPKIDGEQKE